MGLQQLPAAVWVGAIPGIAVEPARGLPDLVILVNLGLFDGGVHVHNGIVQCILGIAERFLLDRGGRGKGLSRVAGQKERGRV